MEFLISAKELVVGENGFSVYNNLKNIFAHTKRTPCKPAMYAKVYLFNLIIGIRHTFYNEFSIVEKELAAKCDDTRYVCTDSKDEKHSNNEKVLKKKKN